jgi:polyferredoxin
VFLYILLIGHYNIILGIPWVRAQDVYINGPRSKIKIITTSIVIRSKKAFYELEELIGQAVNVLAASF